MDILNYYFTKLLKKEDGMHIIYFLLFSLIANQITAMDTFDAQSIKSQSRSSAECLDGLINKSGFSINSDCVEKIKQKLQSALPVIHKIKTVKNEWVQALAFNHTNTLLATGASDGDGKFFDITNLSEINQVATKPPQARFSGNSITHIIFDSDDKMLVYKLSNKNMVIWDITQFPKINKVDTSTQDRTKKYKEEIYPTGTIITRTSDDGIYRIKTLKSLFNRKGTLLERELSSKKISISCSTNPTAYHIDGTHLTVDEEGLWNTTDMSNISLTKKLIMGKALALHPKGILLATGFRNGTINVWDTANLSQIDKAKTFHAHNGPINSLILHKNGNLISGSDDQTIKLWNMTDLSNINEIQTLSNNTSRIDPVVLNSKGTLIASGSNDKTINIYMYIDYILGKITPQELLILNEAYKSNNFNLYKHKYLSEIINTSEFKPELLYLLKHLSKKHLSNLKRTKDI